MEYNLEVNNLTKKYPDFSLKNVNIKLPLGKIIGFIGENGSGKTTTIKAILNLINYDKGNIKILNKNNLELTKEDKEKIGVVLDDSFFSYVLNVNDINNLMKRFYTNWNEKLYYEYITRFNIPKDKTLKEFSSGMKLKIKVICAISHEPKLLILDEPTNGLDPVFRYEILDIFRMFVSNQENSILISTHITSDLEHIADEIIFINEGKIILDIPKNDIDEKYGIISCLAKDFPKIKREDYTKYLKYKNDYKIFVTDKKLFKQKYPRKIIKTPSLEELMLMYIKGE